MSGYYGEKILTTDPRQKLINNVIDKSISSDFNKALSEWSLYDNDNLGGYCACGNKVKYRNILINKNTKQSIIVGDDCLTRFKYGINDVRLDFIKFLHQEKQITQWEYNFMLNIMQFDKISNKQWNVKNKISEKIKKVLKEKYL